MLDAVIIFTKGGIVLWSLDFGQLGHGKLASIQDSLVRLVLLNDDQSSSTLALPPYAVKYALQADDDVVYAVGDTRARASVKRHY